MFSACTVCLKLHRKEFKELGLARDINNILFMSLDWLNIYIEEIDSLIRASRKFIRREGIQGIIVFAGGVGPRPIFSYCNFTMVL